MLQGTERFGNAPVSDEYILNTLYCLPVLLELDKNEVSASSNFGSLSYVSQSMSSLFAPQNSAIVPDSQPWPRLAKSWRGGHSG